MIKKNLPLKPAVEVDGRHSSVDSPRSPRARPDPPARAGDDAAEALHDADFDEENTAQSLVRELSERVLREAEGKRREAELSRELEAAKVEVITLRSAKSMATEPEERGKRAGRWVAGLIAGLIATGGAGAIGAGAADAVRKPRTATVDVTSNLHDDLEANRAKIGDIKTYLKGEAETRETRNRIILAVLCCKGGRFRNVHCDEILQDFHLDDAKACKNNAIVSFGEKDWPDPRLPSIRE